MPGGDDEGMPVEGEPSRKINIHNYHGGTSRGVVDVYEDEDDLLKRYKPRTDRDERILVRKKDKPPEYVPVRKYIEEIKARRK
jgi:hypothetical protein